MWNCWFIGVMAEGYKVRAGSVSQCLEKCPVRKVTDSSIFIPISLFCSVLKFIWEKTQGKFLFSFSLNFFFVWNKSSAELPTAFCVSVFKCRFILLSFKCQMKILLELEMAFLFFFFFFSCVHNYYPVRERSCICVKINFLNYF